MILDETRERFLIAIAKQVDPARIAEIHFFAPIRQGGVESGVAVIAAARAAEGGAAESPSPAGEDPSETSPPEDASVALQDDTVASSHDTIALQADDATLSDDGVALQDHSVAAQDDDAAAPVPIERHVIYTARYRLTLKGPDRGKWETNITAEADAPIITVDAVVRGVQRRAGDVDDATRMNGDEVRAALPAA